MQLRLGELKHVQDIMDMSRRFHEASPYGSMELDYYFVLDKVLKFLDPRGRRENIVFVLEHEDKAVGVIAASIGNSLFNKEKVAYEVIWWVDVEHRSKDSLILVKAYEEWAKECGATYIQMTLLNDLKDKVLDRVYRNLGYKQAEQAYYKEI